jgi:APA family basic amino acid/polyamine antiporter
MIFGRVKPLDAILATAEKKSLHRSLGAVQLTLFGIGCVIGTGIFVLTSAGAQKAGPGLMLAFAIAGLICIVAALCYAEIAAMIPVAGSAYTYTYSVMGELLAWTVGWALVLEYAVAASAVSVGWSGYFNGTILQQFFGLQLPAALSAGPLAFGGAPGGFINLPAVVIALLVTWLLMIGTNESAKVNAVLVAIKVTALTAFIFLTLPAAEMENFNPFLPAGVFGGFGSGVGAVGAAATIFFAYVGFDAVSTAAEEPAIRKRTCRSADRKPSHLHHLLHPGRCRSGRSDGGPTDHGAQRRSLPRRLGRACPPVRAAAICRNAGLLERALAHVAAPDRLLRRWKHARHRRLRGPAFGHPDLLFGQTRIFFVMSRDGLLPEGCRRSTRSGRRLMS